MAVAAVVVVLLLLIITTNRKHYYRLCSHVKRNFLAGRQRLGSTPGLRPKSLDSTPETQGRSLGKGTPRLGNSKPHIQGDFIHIYIYTPQ